MQPASYDLTLRRGDDSRVVFLFRRGEAPVDLTDSTLTLDVVWRGGALNLEAGDELVVDAEAGSVTWPVTVEQSAQIPAGRLATYNLVRADATNGRRTYVTGKITGADGEAPGDQSLTFDITDAPVEVVLDLTAPGGIKGDPGLIVSETEPPLSPGQIAVWLQPTGAGQYNLMIATGE